MEKIYFNEVYYKADINLKFKKNELKMFNNNVLKYQ